MGSTTIFRQIIQNLIIPIIISLVLLAFLNYQHTRSIILKSYTRQNDIISEDIVQMLLFKDLALDIVEDRLDRKMKENSRKILENYLIPNKNPRQLDLFKVRKELGMNPGLEDIYIINSEGIVINTTFRQDLNLDFFSFGREHKKHLKSMLKNNRFVSERFAIEAHTKRFKKYTYEPTPDGNYILELGHYSLKADSVIRFLKKQLRSISEQQENIVSVNLYIGEDKPFSLLKEADYKDGQLLEEVFLSRESRSVVKKYDENTYRYEYIYIERTNTNLYRDSVVRIIYDRKIEKQWLRRELYIVFLIFGISMIIIFVLIYVKTKSITRPVELLTGHVKKIAHGNIKERAEVIGSNEISILAKHINKMLDQLEANYKQLVRARDKARESDKLKTAFLENMSHEIRTPMNAIIGFANIIEGEDLSKEERKTFLNHIKDSTYNLLALITDILDIAKLESGTLTLTHDECHINTLMRQLLDEVQQSDEFNQKPRLDIKLHLALEDQDASVKTDAERLNQVLRYLVFNGIKFNEKGFVEYGYIVKAYDYLLFYVRDTGIGIRKDKHHVIFDRFRQEDDTVTRKYGGTGLGLAISKGLIDLFGGEIWLESETGKGTTFYFTIPYEPVQNESSEKITKSEKELYHQFSWEDKKILIVEDMKIVREYFREVFKPTKIKCFFAESGEKAIGVFQQTSVDIILMDIQLPGIDGYEATKKIRKINPDVPIIAQTAYAYTEDRAKSIRVGCNDYLTKPIDKKVLLETVARYIY